MKIEDPQVNINRQKKLAKGVTRGIMFSPLPPNPENLDALETIVNNQLSAIEKKIGKFLFGKPVLDSQEKLAEFDRLTACRYKAEFELIDMVENFDKEGLIKIMKITGGGKRKIGRINLEISREKRKDDLRYKIILFSFLHTLCESELRKAGLVGRKLIGDSKYKNESNVRLAEIQQWLAMSIIKNPKKNYPQFKEVVDRLERVYNLTLRQKNSVENGVMGFVGAYHYYQSRGFKVLFAKPETDASKGTDLFLVRWGELSPKEKEELDREGIENVDALSYGVRKKVYKVQAKCHANPNVPTSEMIYDFEKNKVYAGEDKYLKGIDKYSISADDYDYTPDDEAYWFFEGQCQGLTHGRYLDIKIQDARAYILEEKEDQ